MRLRLQTSVNNGHAPTNFSPGSTRMSLGERNTAYTCYKFTQRVFRQRLPPGPIALLSKPRWNLKQVCPQKKEAMIAPEEMNKSHINRREIRLQCNSQIETPSEMLKMKSVFLILVLVYCVSAWPSAPSDMDTGSSVAPNSGYTRCPDGSSPLVSLVGLVPCSPGEECPPTHQCVNQGAAAGICCRNATGKL